MKGINIVPNFPKNMQNPIALLKFSVGYTSAVYASRILPNTITLNLMI